MKIDSGTDFLNGGETSHENAEVLKESANDLYQGSNKHVALFLLYTSCEELEKAIFCLLVHFKHLNHTQINSVFTLHQLKIIFFEKIFIDNTFEYINGDYLLDGELLKNIDFQKIVQQNDTSWKKYKKERESCLYVEPQGKNWHQPKSIIDIEKKWSDTNRKWHGLSAFYKFLENGSGDDCNIVSLIVNVSNGQNKSDMLIFNGTGKAMK